MVYSPSVYLFPAALALLLKHTSASSLYYDPVTVSGTTEELSPHFPAYGDEIADLDCVISKEEDPTLPNINTIPFVPVEFPYLLTNKSAVPPEPVFKKVGTSLLFEESSSPDDYISKSTTGWVPGSAKPGVKCATGWEKVHEPPNLETKRRLEAMGNQDIAKLEAYFQTKMVMTVDDLPTVAVVTPLPWSGPYWATVDDSINVRWDNGGPSAAEKYATAFGLDVKTFMDNVSKENGVKSKSNRPVCTTDDSCASLNDGSLCGTPWDNSTSHCVQGWNGICHAWSAAAILEPEPNCPVTFNGVTFEPLDIKALLSLVYDRSRVGTVFLASRYNGGPDTIDRFGRHSNSAFLDMNPALFHIVNGNVLGLLNRTYIADVEANAEVWNQPIFAYKIYEQTKMTPQEAAQKFWGLDEYPWNAAADSIVFVTARVTWIVESYADGGLVRSGEIYDYMSGDYFYYLLELDSNSRITGGEWLYGSETQHFDFAWIPKSKPDPATVTSAGLSYANVEMLLQKSVACET
ncbi:hypothetical protein PsorP6_011417 [Peronosclerospora sorghi]|uniref:Uncharacterized protein n=1 Tax=Peronosclerospora sorghi TaxID=230839 RepID=A0ACC0WK02_9STRA|nr:hypothetical protein PsorP6_011417 [Peronosclerospora sorghi]